MLLMCELTLKHLFHSFGRSLEKRDFLVNRSATPDSIREQQNLPNDLGVHVLINQLGPRKFAARL